MTASVPPIFRTVPRPPEPAGRAAPTARLWVLAPGTVPAAVAWVWWVLAGAALWPTSSALLVGIAGWDPSRVYGADLVLPTAVAGLIGGLLFGSAQWLVLRRRVRGAGWWLLAAPAGWGLGALAAALVPTAGEAVLAGGAGVRLALVGTGYGALTAVVLARLTGCRAVPGNAAPVRA